VQQFLRQLRKDHLVVPLPLGGNSMINGSREAELAEMKRICADMHVLIDSERTAAGAPLARDRREFAELCARMGIPCHVLERRATENYLTDAAVKNVKGAKYRAPGPYEHLNDLPLPWSKADNWRIAGKMSISDLEGTDLGAFLAAL
jgi:hypothetical protein